MYYNDMKDFIEENYSGAIIWGFEESRDYVYARFTSGNCLYMLSHFKHSEHGRIEIFKLEKEV